jgi:secreted trypsin-like serine protease
MSLATSLFLLLIHGILFGKGNHDVRTSESTACWNRHLGVCVETKDDCPFENGIDTLAISNNLTVAKQLCNVWNRRCCIPPTKPPQPRKNNICGFSNVVNQKFRISSGLRAKPGAWPWMVKLKHCGGTLINEKWVLTAAHCPRDGEYAVFGDYDVDEFEGSEQVATVKRYIAHEKYEDSRHGVIPEAGLPYDIALVELATPVEFTEHVRPVCLPNKSERFEEMVCTVTGFGWIEEYRPSTELMELNLPTISREECQRNVEEHVYHSNICAGFKYGTRDACEGDSGGPLVCHNRDQFGRIRWALAGVVSFGSECGTVNGGYGIYTRVSSYLDWIREITGIEM